MTVSTCRVRPPYDLWAGITITCGLIDSRHGIVNLACGTDCVPFFRSVTGFFDMVPDAA